MNDSTNFPEFQSRSLPDVSNMAPSEVAQAYAAAGFPVFPCDDSKRPRVKGGFKVATTDAAQIAEWWEQWPDAMGGMPTGEVSGVWISDVDVKNGKDGEDSLFKLEREHCKLPDTWTTLTPSGGFHHWWLWDMPEGVEVRSSVEKLGSGLDVRGNGGYVILPGFGVNGHRYEWEGSSDPSEGAQIAVAPEWLLSLVTQPKRPEGAPAAPAKPVPPEDWARWQRALEFLSKTPAVDDYDQWLAVGMAIDAGIEDRDVGLECWDRWSQCGAKYGGFDVLWNKWQGFDRSKGRTYRTVFEIAKQYEGWQEWTIEEMFGSVQLAPPENPVALMPTLDDVKKAIAALAMGDSVTPILQQMVMVDEVRDIPTERERLIACLKQQTGIGIPAIRNQLGALIKDYRRTQTENEKRAQQGDRFQMIANIENQLRLDDGSGKPTKCKHNLDVILRNGHGSIYPTLRYNRLSERMEMHDPEDKFPYDPETHDAQVTALQTGISTDFGIDFGVEEMYRHAELIALGKAYHPVLDYLNTLQWDGVSRLESFFPRFMQTDDSPYTRALGKTLFCGAVQRALYAGSKFDWVIVLESPEQGRGKSKAVRALCPDPRWYMDAGFNPRDFDKTAHEIQGKWIVEIGELEGFYRSTHTAIKQFITKQADEFRPPYGRTPRPFYRKCIFVATTNEETYLHDPTGARRFLPVRCKSTADVDGIIAHRDQLWAEAYAEMTMFYDNAWSIYQDPDIEQMAEAETESRFEDDPWVDVLEDYLRNRNRVATMELLEALEIAPKDQDRKHRRRLAAVMRRMPGWSSTEGKTVRPDGGKYAGKPKKGYESVFSGL